MKTCFFSGYYVESNLVLDYIVLFCLAARNTQHGRVVRIIKSVGICLLDKSIYDLASKSMIGTITDPAEEEENNLPCKHPRELLALSEGERGGDHSCLMKNQSYGN